MYASGSFVVGSRDCFCAGVSDRKLLYMALMGAKPTAHPVIAPPNIALFATRLLCRNLWMQLAGLEVVAAMPLTQHGLCLLVSRGPPLLRQSPNASAVASLSSTPVQTNSSIPMSTVCSSPMCTVLMRPFTDPPDPAGLR